MFEGASSPTQVDRLRLKRPGHEWGAARRGEVKTVDTTKVTDLDALLEETSDYEVMLLQATAY